MKYVSGVRNWFWVAPVVLGGGFSAAGFYMIAEGRKAKRDVKDAILREKLRTSTDAAFPDVPITDAATAEAEAIAIENHTLEMTGGKTFFEIDPDDPNNEAAFRATSLRTSLNLAVMGFKVSDLVIGMGAFLVAVGGTFIAFLAPTVRWAALVANEKAEPERKGLARLAHRHI